MNRAEQISQMLGEVSGDFQQNAKTVRSWFNTKLKDKLELDYSFGENHDGSLDIKVTAVVRKSKTDYDFVLRSVDATDKMHMEWDIEGISVPGGKKRFVSEIKKIVKDAQSLVLKMKKHGKLK